MGSHKSKNAGTLGIHVSNELIEKIQRRAKALGCSKSRYAAMILEKWEADGEKPISAADRALYVLGKSFPEAATVETPPRFGKTSKPDNTPPRATVSKKGKSSTGTK